MQVAPWKNHKTMNRGQHHKAVREGRERFDLNYSAAKAELDTAWNAYYSLLCPRCQHPVWDHIGPGHSNPACPTCGCESWIHYYLPNPYEAQIPATEYLKKLAAADLTRFCDWSLHGPTF